MIHPQFILSKESVMSKFILGVVVTLAVLNPAVTKTLFGSAVDTTNAVVTTTIDKAAK
jgi:hypothetical protein